MESKSFKKYPEIEIGYDLFQRNLSFRAPWMDLEFEVEAENEERVNVALLAIEKSNLNQKVSAQEQEQVNWLLSSISEFPVAYVLPRKIQDYSQSSFHYSDALKEWLTKTPQGCVHSIDSDIKISVPNKWSWAESEILESSRISGNSYDPLSIYTQVRRSRLIAESEAKQNFSWYESLDDLRKQDESSFIEMSKFAIRQTHYVTQHCTYSLAPAVDSFVEARNHVKDFIREEHGHDKLVWRSLSALGVENPNEVELLPETKMSMELLRFSAEQAPLAFACLIGVFEGTGYTEKDPMATLLEMSSYPEAAEGLQIHFEINRDHKHSAVGETLLENMGAVSYEHAVAAIRLSELIVEIGNQLTLRLQEKILLTKGMA